MRAKLIQIALLSVLSVFDPAAASADDVSAWCGTLPSTPAIHAALHRDHMRRLAREKAGSPLTSAVVTNQGEVAVIQDDGFAILRSSSPDLEGLAIQFQPRGGGYVISTRPASLSEPLGKKLTLGDDDALKVAFPPGFTFRFFGKTYRSVFVNSDGNLTFGRDDQGQSARWLVSFQDLTRLIEGPPRIAGFFSDLDPSAAEGDGGVYLLSAKDRVTITWLAVPRGASQVGTPRPNTFQITLLSGGRLTLRYGHLEGVLGVVGVSPGGGGTLEMVDYTSEPRVTIPRQAVAERFTLTNTLDEYAVARLFLSRYADVYDQLIVFTDFKPPNYRSTLLGYSIGVKNEVAGIGVPVFDSSGMIGSTHLGAVVEMSYLDRFPDDPDKVAFPGDNSLMSLVAHEVGHRWLAALRFRDAAGKTSSSLITPSAHWNFFTQASASVMLGNAIEETSPGRFLVTSATERYGPLDQYAMGLIPAEEVPPLFYVGPWGDSPTSDWPVVGAQMTGKRVDVRIEDITAAMGPRVPDSASSPKQFRMAFVILTEGGPPSPETVAKVDRYRQRWESYFAEATDSNASVDTRLVRR